VEWNYGYCVLLIEEEAFGCSRDVVHEGLKRKGIYSRRYFYPLISECPTYRGLPGARPEDLPVAHQISRQVLCLPMYPDLDPDTQAGVIGAVRNCGRCHAFPLPAPSLPPHRTYSEESNCGAHCVGSNLTPQAGWACKET